MCELTRTKFKMCHTQWNNLEVLSSELGSHGKFLPAAPISAFTVLCKHWWMVGDLEGKSHFFYNNLQGSVLWEYSDVKVYIENWCIHLSYCLPLLHFGMCWQNLPICFFYSLHMIKLIHLAVNYFTLDVKHV